MKIEVNKEQLEILKYAILWYECNDKEEERIVEGDWNCVAAESQTNHRALENIQKGD